MKGIIALFAGRDRYQFMIALGVAFGLLAGVLGLWSAASRGEGLVRLKFRAAAAPDDGWKLLFEDGFGGRKNAKPAAHWIHDIGHRTVSPLGGQGPMNFGTTEIARMTDDPANVSTDGEGNLAITPRRSAAGEWTSGRINSEQVFKPVKGGQLAFEARIQMPQVTGEKALGYWPAFWLLNQAQRLHPEAGNWPSGGEIDIVENVNGLNRAFTTLHCGVRGGGDQGGPCNEHAGRGASTECAPASCQDGPHVYRLEFDRRTDEEVLRWYLDGKLVHRLARDETPDGANGAQWHQAWDNMTRGEGFFVILNVAVGGDMPRGNGGDVSPATEPGHPMLVDYVKVMARGAGAPDEDVATADPDKPSASPAAEPTKTAEAHPKPTGSPSAPSSPSPSRKSTAPWSPPLVQAESYSGQSGIRTDLSEDIGGTEFIGWIVDGDWARYDQVDFGPEGPKKLIARVSGGGGGAARGKVEIRLDDPAAAPAAALDVADTGGWEDWEDATATLPSIGGEHTVYLKFVSGQKQEFVNLNWFIILP